MSFIITRTREPVWPQPKDSIGRAFGRYKDSKMFYWEAKGPAMEAYNQLLPDIKRTLAEKQGPLPNSDFIWFGLYMVGPDIDKTQPHIMFTGENKAARKKAMEIISKSGVLSEYPGMHVGQWAGPPHIGIQKLCYGSHSKSSTGPPISFPHRIDLRQFDTGSRMGMTLEFHLANRTVHATSGFAWQYKSAVFWLTAAHVLLEHDSTPSLEHTTSDTSSHDYQFAGFRSSYMDGRFNLAGTKYPNVRKGYADKALDNSNDTLQEADISMAGAGGYMAGAWSLLSLRPWRTTAPPLISMRDIPAKRIDFPIVSAPLDYMLYQSPLGKNQGSSMLQVLTQENILDPEKLEQRNTALVHTAHGLLRGTIQMTGAHLILPGSKKYQEVLVAHLSSPVLAGDSGAAVSNESGQIYGHIVSGSSASVAFVIPIHHVYKDIIRRSKSMELSGGSPRLLYGLKEIRNRTLLMVFLMAIVAAIMNIFFGAARIVFEVYQNIGV